MVRLGTCRASVKSLPVGPESNYCDEDQEPAYDEGGEEEDDFLLSGDSVEALVV